MTIEKKLTFFAETRHSYGKTALFLSGGASFGKWHFGTLRALYEQDLFPRIVVGASVGALIGTIICTSKYSEMPSLFDPYNIFKYPIIGLKTKSKFEIIWRLLREEPLLETQVLKDYIIRFTGDITFKEIFDKFGWNLNITVTDFSEQQDAKEFSAGWSSC